MFKIEEIFDLTITKEDMELALRHHLKTKEIYILNYFKAYPERDENRFIQDYPCIKISKKRLNRTICKLVNKGLIEKVEINHEEIVEKLKSNSIEKPYICEWCGENVATVDEHHYPIPKSKGGTEVVRICPNCHYTFHRIAGVRWCKE